MKSSAPLIALAWFAAGVACDHARTTLIHRQQTGVLPVALRSFYHSVHGHADVVMIGDSLTAFAQWNELFPGVRIINRGIGGDTTYDVRARLDDINLATAKTAFIMEGINQLTNGERPEKIAADYELLIFQLRGAGVRVVVQSTLPIAEWRENSVAINSGAEQLNKLMAIFCRFNGIEFVRVNVTDARAFYIFDGLHITGEGYLSWRDQIAPYMRANP